jgi:hypothetical protein
VIHLNPDQVAPVLEFLAEVSQEVKMKEWLGSAEGSSFWEALLQLLCISNSPLNFLAKVS